MLDSNGKWAPSLTPKGYQVLNDYHRFLLLSGPRQCLDAPTMISTPRGLFRLKDLAPQDRLFWDNEPLFMPVFSFDGARVQKDQIIEIHNNPDPNGIRLNFSHGAHIKASPNHPIWAHWEALDGQPQFGYLTALAIMELLESNIRVFCPFLSGRLFEDGPVQHVKISVRREKCLLCDRPIAGSGLCTRHFADFRRHNKPTLSSFEDCHIPIDETMGYFLGAMCGDGGCKSHSANGKEIGIRFTNMDSECTALVEKAVSVLKGELKRVCPDKYDYRINGRRPRHLIIACGLNKGSKEKRIPSVILRSPKKVLAAFLRGLFDTDGYSTENEIGIGLTNEDLIRDIHQCLCHFGIFATIRPPHSSSSGFRLSIYARHAVSFMEQIGFAIVRKQRSFVRKHQLSKFGFPPTIRKHLLKRISSTKLKKDRQWHRKQRWRQTLHIYTPNLERIEKFVNLYGSDPILEQYLISNNWVEVTSANRCTGQFLDVTVRKHSSFLACGIPNHNTSKTTCAINRICRHLWENDGAMVAIIGKSIRVIKSSGIWNDLVVCPTGIRQWLEAGIGFKYVVEPKLTGDTKMTFFRIRNMHGGISECQVHSLEHDHEVEAKFKGTRYSCFYLPEADQFRSPNVLKILDDQLRIMHMRYEDHQIILDCNPAEEGDEHWIYQYFYRKLGEDNQPFAPEYAEQFQVYEFFLEDNPFLHPKAIANLRNKYRHDRIKNARYVDGLWVRDNTNGIFEDVFEEGRHVLGDIKKPAKEDWEIIIPGQSTFLLVTGWDPGDVNHSCTFFAPRQGLEATHFDVIDEVVVTDVQMSLADFTEDVMEKMDFWENLLREMYGTTTILWRHWTDSSATKYRASSDTYDANVIRSASDNRIHLTPVVKTSGSIKKRIDLVRKLVFEDRIKFSAQCVRHVAMMNYLKKGPTRGEPIRRGDPHKHAFDSLSYALENEAPADLERRNTATVAKASNARIVSVR